MVDVSALQSIRYFYSVDKTRRGYFQGIYFQVKACDKVWNNWKFLTCRSPVTALSTAVPVFNARTWSTCRMVILIFWPLPKDLLLRSQRFNWECSKLLGYGCGTVGRESGLWPIFLRYLLKLQWYFLLNSIVFSDWTNIIQIELYRHQASMYQSGPQRPGSPYSLTMSSGAR